MTAPQPPAADNGARVTTVMAGEPWTDPNGAERIAHEDCVQLRQFLNGQFASVLILDPESAIVVARLLSDAAVDVMSREVDDDGNHPSLLARMKRINEAHRKALDA